MWPETKGGITAFQLNIKYEGLMLDTIAQALDQARDGKLSILGEMEKALERTRAELPATVPRVLKMEISEGSIKKFIGTGGEQIWALIEDF